VERVARREARDPLELVAVDDRRVMVARLDDDEEVQRIGGELRLRGQRAVAMVDDARRKVKREKPK